ncbi:hypothetical protein GCM10017687_58440 [Streptomyces echinatus]
MGEVPFWRRTHQLAECQLPAGEHGHGCLLGGRFLGLGGQDVGDDPLRQSVVGTETTSRAGRVTMSFRSRWLKVPGNIEEPRSLLSAAWCQGCQLGIEVVPHDQDHAECCM